MDIINHLARTVTPAVLGDNRNPQSESLLEQFYAIFAARLADNDTYSRFTGQEIARDDLGFYDRVWTDQTHRASISRELATSHNVDETTAKSLVAAAAPLAYHEISSLAGTTPIPQFLRDNLSTYQHQIPSWAGAVLPAGVLAAHAQAEPAHAATAGHRISDTTSTTALHHEEKKKEGSFLKALLPIIGLIILGALAWALLKGCQENPEPVGTPVTQEAPADENTTAVAADIQPSSLRLATGEGNTLYACRIHAGDESLKTKILDAVKSVFGTEADKCRVDVDDSYGTDMPAVDQLSAILPLIKSSPNATMLIKGDEVIVNSPDQATLDKLIADIQAAAPGLKVSAEGPLDAEAEVQNSLSAADAALGRLGSNPDPSDVARALSLQVINFAVDKSEIPEVNKPLLDRAAKIINDVPDMKLMIIGHTDKTASSEYNMTLSQQRADAVKKYLVAKGVDESKLMTKGMGEKDPIADNSTDQGKFRNRRIEFTVYDESMETDDNGIEVNASNTGLGATVQDGLNSATATAGNAVNSASNAVKEAGDAISNADPDLNPLDNNNDDVLPDSDDPSKGTKADPKANQ